MMNLKKIFIFAGEESGDIRGAELITALLKSDPGLHIDAVGGKRMKSAGAKIIFDITELAVVGFVEVLKHYLEFRSLMNEVTGILEKGDYSAVVLIDYPGFNLRLAKKIKPFNIPVIYYISPQVWAWGKKRSRKIAGLVDKMIVLFDFEKEIYVPYGLDTVFVGHPMVDMVGAYIPEDIRSFFQIPEQEKIIGLLPGSRVKEVEKIFPAMLDAVELFQKEENRRPLHFIVSAARKDLEPIITGEIERRGNMEFIRVYSGDVSHILNGSDIAVVASGTATLQTCLFEKPMVVVYKVAFITWLIAKMLVKIPHIAMVNVVSGERNVPELVQWDMTGNRIAEEVKKYLDDEAYRKKVVEGLKRVKEKLGHGGAAEKAAHTIMDFIDKK